MKMFPFVYPMKAHMDVSSKFNKRTFLPIGIWSCKLFTHCHMTYAWQHKCQRRRARAWTSTQTPPSGSLSRTPQNAAIDFKQPPKGG